MRNTVIKSCGAYLPENVLTNADLEKIVDTNDEWIQKRTGIKERRIAADDETTGDMAVKAAQKALDNGGFSADDIDLVLIATSTPDTTFPSVAVKVQAELGIKPCPAFDIQAVCSGFVYALTVADSLIKTGVGQRILLVGAEKMSAILNWEDRVTCVLFGDGAGAVILEADDSGTGQGILSTHLYADGNLKDLLYTSGGTATTKDSGTIVMDGKEVFRYAVKYMADIVTEVLEHNNLKPEDIDWLIPHQANSRIIEATAKKLNMSMERIVMTVDRHGNTSAASIPMALCEAVDDGRIRRGDLILMEALGAGFTWGAVLARF